MPNIPTTTDETGRTVAAQPIRMVAGTTAQNEAGQTVDVLPIRTVVGNTATDASGKTIGTLPVSVIATTSTTDETGRAIGVRPAREVAGLTATNAAGQIVDVVPVRAIGGTPTPTPTPLIASINAEGWSAEWASGTPPTFTPDTAPSTFSVSRAGYDATGATTTYTGTRTFTRRKRNVYPNQLTDTATTVALDDYVYSTDTISGVTNNSTEASPVPVAAWAMPDMQLIGNTLHWEIAAFHRNFRNGRQVAAVFVTATDGTNTVTQTVSSTSLSTLCEDATSVELFVGDLDVTSLSTGKVTLNAKVYPWIGNALSVLDSSLNSVAREFSPRYFLKNVTRAASPPLAYVQSTGNDTTGVWSTTAATAAATPFLTVGGAIQALDNATRGTPATGGVADGGRIRIVDTVSLGTCTTSRPQNVASVVVERAPGTTRANAIVTLTGAMRARLGVGTLTSPLTEGAITFYDVTVSRTVNTTFSGEAANQLRVMFWNTTIANASTAGSWLANAHDYFYGVQLTGFNGNIGQSTLQHRIMRGLTVDFANGNAPEGWVTIGCQFSRVKGVTYADPTKGAIHYSNKYLSPDSTAAPIIIDTGSVTNSTITGFVVVGNLIEVTHTTSSTPALRTSSDTPLLGNTVHVIHAHNTITGYGSAGRGNLFYDNTAATGRTHRLMRDVGNIYVQLNTKGDVFNSDGTKTGQFAYSHGVGCQGNVSQYATNSAGTYSEYQTYPGLGAKIGTNAQTPQFANSAIWTNYQGTTGSGGTAVAGAGGGTYTLAASSPAAGVVTVIGLSYGLAGASRGTTTTGAGAYA